jgi:hypothetical protein
VNRHPENSFAQSLRNIVHPHESVGVLSLYIHTARFS